MMKKVFALVALLVGQYFTPVIAGEGMWIPMLLQQMNEKEMQEMGLVGVQVLYF